MQEKLISAWLTFATLGYILIWVLLEFMASISMPPHTLPEKLLVFLVHLFPLILIVFAYFIFRFLKQKKYIDALFLSFIPLSYFFILWLLPQLFR